MFGERFRDREAETDTVGRFVFLVEAVENVWESFGRNSLTVVCDGERVRRKADFDFSFGILDGVIEENTENLEEVSGINLNLWRQTDMAFEIFVLGS